MPLNLLKIVFLTGKGTLISSWQSCYNRWYNNNTCWQSLSVYFVLGIILSTFQHQLILVLCLNEIIHTKHLFPVCFYYYSLGSPYYPKVTKEELAVIYNSQILKRDRKVKWLDQKSQSWTVTKPQLVLMSFNFQLNIVSIWLNRLLQISQINK